MITTVFVEKKISITPKETNDFKSGDKNGLQKITQVIENKAKQLLDNKCSEDGFILPGSTLVARSIGYFESARFTGDVNYYVKMQCRVLYPVDGAKLTGVVKRKNKMGLYVIYDNAIHIQVPRELHIGNIKFDRIAIGDEIVIELHL